MKEKLSHWLNGGFWGLKTKIQDIEHASNLIGRVHLPSEMGWLRPPRGLGHVILWAHSFVFPLPQSRIPTGPILFWPQLPCKFWVLYSNKHGGKGKNVLLLPKSARGLNFGWNPPDLSFTRKDHPSGCLVDNFAKGSFLAIHHDLGRGYGHMDQVPNPTHPKKTSFTPLYFNWCCWIIWRPQLLFYLYPRQVRLTIWRLKISPHWGPFNRCWWPIWRPQLLLALYPRRGWLPIWRLRNIPHWVWLTLWLIHTALSTITRQGKLPIWMFYFMLPWLPIGDGRQSRLPTLPLPLFTIMIGY